MLQKGFKYKTYYVKIYKKLFEIKYLEGTFYL